MNAVSNEELGFTEVNDMAFSDSTAAESEPVSEYNADSSGIDADASSDKDDVRSREALIDSDLEELKREFSELKEIKSITELKNPTRYAALRELGLSVSEAYLATTPRAAAPDNRAHLKSSVPSAARSPHSSMTRQEMNEARAIFGDISDSEIQKLYQRVTR